jgi:hypothetical protein
MSSHEVAATLTSETIMQSIAWERAAILSPWDLNPVENIWQFVRDNWLSNRVFFSYDNILDHCCDAWNKLVDQPWTIMSIGLRDWAHGF